MKLFIANLMLFLFALATANITMEYSSLVDPFAAIQNPCDDIRNGQFVCKDCATLAFCVQQNGLWNSMEIGSCDTTRGLYCDEEARGCIYKKECTNRGPKFECQNSGTFPDPYDCKQYHVCSAAKEDVRVVCPQGTAYSPATKSCSLSSNDNICHKAQYTCDKPLDTGAWPSDPNIYYVCWYTTVDGETVRYPLLHRCQDGYHFKANGCVPASGTGVNAPGTTSTMTANTSATTMSTTCDLGSGLKVNANDCYSYYVCTNGQLVSMSCPSGTYFNAASSNCMFGSC